MGVRTKSWTVKGGRIGVRMYSKENVELFLLAREDGMSIKGAAAFAKVNYNAAKDWIYKGLPHSYTGALRKSQCARIQKSAKPSGEKEYLMSASPYDPPKSGPLAGLSPDQIENLLLRAVLADLKAVGWDPALISNRSKCGLGERLRQATGLPLRLIIAFLKISKSSYEYHRSRLGQDKYERLRTQVRSVFREGQRRWGYRTVHARLKREGTHVSEKVVRRIMAEEGLKVVYNKKRPHSWSSYVGEISKAPKNLISRNFHALAPDELWLTDITEFRLPCAKIYLSAIVDCFDGKCISWSIGRHPSKQLANSSLTKALSQRRPGSHTTIHSDRGGHYRWPEWIAICDESGLRRSMSAKGSSPDNAACEGFFGRLKNEFFYYRDWKNISPEIFMAELDAYLTYYDEGRIKRSLGWLSPNEYRRALGYMA